MNRLNEKTLIDSGNVLVKSRLEKLLNESGIQFDREKLDESLELDSLHYISIICEIENEFEIEVSDEVLLENKLESFNDFIKLIEGDI